MNAFDLLDAFNWIDKIEGAITRLVWRDAGHQMRVPHDCGHTGQELEDVLARYGVAVAGRRANSTHLIFYVKRRQARWAEHVLLRAGVTPDSAQVDASNAGAYQRHNGTMPRPWSDNAQHPRRHR